jgi:2Fe-2S ferredoxin
MTVTVHFIHNGSTHTVEAPAGKSLMLAALEGGVDGIAADCGGMLSCATCHVYVPDIWAAKLEPMTEDEDSMLDFAAAPRRPGSRLSCQLKLTDELSGLTVDVPDTQY